MVWGRITTTKGPELGRACRRSTQVHAGFLSRPNGTELPERPKQAPRIPEKTDFCNLDFENRNYARLRVFFFFLQRGRMGKKEEFLHLLDKNLGRSLLPRSMYDKRPRHLY